MAASGGGQLDIPEMSTESRFQRLRQRKSSTSLRSKGKRPVIEDAGNQPDNSEGEAGSDEDESIQYEYRETSRVTTDVPPRPDEPKADKKTIRYLMQRQDATELKLDRLQEASDKRHTQAMEEFELIKNMLVKRRNPRRIPDGQTTQAPRQITSSQDADPVTLAGPAITRGERFSIPPLPPASEVAEDFYNASPNRRFVRPSHIYCQDPLQSHS